MNKNAKNIKILKEKSYRKQFKKDLYKEIKDDKIKANLIVLLYTYRQTKTNMNKALLFIHENGLYKEYEDFWGVGKTICSNANIYSTLYLINKDILNKYKGKIRHEKLLGDALSVALNTK